ncbi:MAG TPA: hypothetical protein VK524_08105, partial [Polyangiaceae bacterium]|nr:hypothetical protein [Polyangiaceae bacterium]
RGDYPGSLRMYALLNAENPRQYAGWAGMTGSLAAVYNALGDPARAKNICEDALQRLPAEDRAFAVMNMRLDIELARARAALGEVEEAAAALDRLADEHRAGQNPLTLGTIHGARSRIAILQKDIPSFGKHKEQMERWFRQTRNPALIAQCEKLDQLALQSGLDVGPGAGAFAADSFESISRSLVASSSDREERGRRALELVLRETRGSRGFLFEKVQGGLRLLVSISDRPPSPELELDLTQKVAEASEGVSVQSEASTARRQERDSAADITQNIGMVLCTHLDGRLVVFGAVAIEGLDLAAPSHPFLQAITRGMLGPGTFGDTDLAGEACTSNIGAAHPRKLN